MKIFAFHLLNDYSGSPKVLMQLVKGWVNNEMNVTIVTASGRHGFLSNINGVSYINFRYTFAKNPFIRLINFMLSQLHLFFKLIFKVKKTDIVYINTVLPFGAALLGKLKGCRIIYHVHETSVKPKILKKFLFTVVNYCSSDVVFVSDFLRDEEKHLKPKKHILYNAIENTFLEESLKARDTYTKNRNVLMICSLKEYKGVNEFVSLASQLNNFNFTLVVNASENEINSFFYSKKLPENLTIYPTQTDTHPFYRWADVVVNLSRKDEWVETFGLTVLEGMAYGLPAIVPVVGGITELVDEGANGYHIDSKEVNSISKALNYIFENNTVFQSMRLHSQQKIKQYTEEHFINRSIQILQTN